jgi:hypothetical protein
MTVILDDKVADLRRKLDECRAVPSAMRRWRGSGRWPRCQVQADPDGVDLRSRRGDDSLLGEFTEFAVCLPRMQAASPA